MTQNVLPRQFDLDRILKDYERRIRVLELSLQRAGLSSDVSTEWVSVSHTVAPDTSVDNVFAARLGKIVSIYAQGQVDLLGVPTSGNITNQTLFTVTDSRFIPSTHPNNQGLDNGGSGRLTGFGIWPNGDVRMTSLAPTSTWTSSIDIFDQDFSVAGVYFV